MSSWELKIIASEADRLLAMAVQDAEIRAALRSLAERILAATEARASRTLEAAEAAVAPESGPPQPARSSPEPAPPRPARPVETPEPLRELTLGRQPVASLPPPIPSASRSVSLEDELDELERRCRARCEAIRWQVESHRRLWEGVESPIEDAPVDPEIVEWSGRLVDCFYWLDEQQASNSGDLTMLDDVGGCYEALAEALRLMPGGETRRGKLERALPLLAEAQSMVRQALQRLWAPNDPDQLAAYQIAREAAARHRIFVRRYLRADDPAEPTEWPGLLARIEAATNGSQQSRQQQEIIARLREHLEPIRRGEATDERWQAAIDLVEQAVDEGIPPSNREIRESLLPLIDDLPDREDLPAGFRLVLREIDRYLATRPSPSKSAPVQASPPDVKAAARLLQGRSVVLIGGIRRREAQESLRKALGLRDLIWIETREHQSIDPFEPVVARPDVALVLLAIRWSSHSFGDVRQFCIRHGKPLVRLPGGYGPHQVAVQILAQASEVLAGE